LKRVVFVRHGATEGNLQKRYIGRTDEPLCEQGIAQIKALSGLKADRIVVSPMLRTRQSAALLFPGRELELCPDLRETDFGEFEGKTASELTDNKNYVNWVNGGCIAPIPGGEAVADFKARCRAAFEEIMAGSSEDSTTVFVIHGGCIMAILEAFSRPKRDFYAFHLPNGGCFRAEMDGNGSVLTVVSAEKT